VRLANSGWYLHWSALAKVDRAGLKRTAWSNATKSAGVALPTVALALCVVGVAAS